MSTPARRRQAAWADKVLAAALGQVGAKAMAEAMLLWSQDVAMAPAQVGASAAKFLPAVTRLISWRRRMVRDMSWAYYRYTRALHTGFVPQDWSDPGDPRTSVPLSELRDDFITLVERYAPEAVEAFESESGSRVPRRAERPSETNLEPPEATAEQTDLDRELEEAILEQEVLDREEMERLEREFEQEMSEILEGALDDLESTTVVEDDETTVGEADDLREDAHNKGRNKVGRHAERMVQNGGRHTITAATGHDRRALGYVRVSTAPPPCGFCAVLISRSIEDLFKSEDTAGNGAQGDQYHTNCNCEPRAVYSEEQFFSDPQFALNREYRKLWDSKFRNLPGSPKARLAAWRKHFRNLQG